MCATKESLHELYETMAVSKSPAESVSTIASLQCAFETVHTLKIDMVENAELHSLSTLKAHAVLILHLEQFYKILMLNLND